MPLPVDYDNNAHSHEDLVELEQHQDEKAEFAPHMRMIDHDDPDLIDYWPEDSRPP